MSARDTADRRLCVLRSHVEGADASSHGCLSAATCRADEVSSARPSKVISAEAAAVMIQDGWLLTVRRQSPPDLPSEAQPLHRGLARGRWNAAAAAAAAASPPPDRAAWDVLRSRPDSLGRQHLRSCSVPSVHALMRRATPETWASFSRPLRATPRAEVRRRRRRRNTQPPHAASRTRQSAAVAAASQLARLPDPCRRLRSLRRRLLGCPALRVSHVNPMTACCPPASSGLGVLAAEGLVGRLIYGWTGTAPAFLPLVASGAVQAWNLPLGVVSHRIRDVAAGRPGPVTSVGLGTFVDPRSGGGRLNDATREQLVEVVELGGRQYLWYKVGTCRGLDP